MFNRKKKKKRVDTTTKKKISVRYAYLVETVSIIIEYNDGMVILSPFQDGLKFELYTNRVDPSIKDIYTSIKSIDIKKNFSFPGLSLTYVNDNNQEVVTVQSDRSHYILSFQMADLVSIESARDSNIF